MRGKRSTKKVSLAKAKRVVGKAHKRAAKTNKDTFFLKAKVSAVLTPGQGSVVSNYIYRHFPLMDPTGPTSISQIPEFNLYRIQYDQVRINRVTIVVTPKANVLDQGVAQADGVLQVAGNGMIYSAIDRDGPAPSNPTAIERYPSMRKHSVLKKIKRSYSIKWNGADWLDCQNIYATAPEDTLRRWGAFGGVTLYGENFLEEIGETVNEPWADVEIYYDCVFRGKTSASLSVGVDGSVTLTPQEVFTPLSFSPLGVGTYTLHASAESQTIDNTGATVTMSDRQDHS